MLLLVLLLLLLLLLLLALALSPLSVVSLRYCCRSLLFRFVTARCYGNQPIQHCPLLSLLLTVGAQLLQLEPHPH
jgi:hypothetical protein